MKYLVLLFFGLTILAGITVTLVAATDTHVRPVPDEVPGFHQASLPVAHRDETLQVYIWYPAQQGDPAELIGQNALFFGEHVLRDAPIVPGAHPLVVLSHGSGGNAVQLSWLAAALVREGAIVVATDHPGTRSRDSDPNQTVQIWNRPRDLTALIDLMSDAAPRGLLIDPDAITTLGFSLGGPAALHLAGLRYDKAAFLAYCAEIPDEWDCGWFNENDVDLAAIDADLYGASYRDPRVSAAIAIDPALSRAATQQSAEAVDRPILLINFANDGLVPGAMMAGSLAAALPAAQYARIDQAWHFSFLQECSDFGRFIIGLLSSDNICGDPQGKTRAEVHDAVLAHIVPFLNDPSAAVAR